MVLPDCVDEQLSLVSGMDCSSQYNAMSQLASLVSLSLFLWMMTTGLLEGDHL
jgi:hypothetical protein